MAVRKEIEGKAAPRPSNRFNTEVAKQLLFDREASKIAGFITACILYIRIRIRKIVVVVEKQIQWILMYV